VKISFGPFSGMRPRTHKRFLGDTEAQEAINCDLTSGSLKARYDGLTTAQLASSGWLQTIYLWGAGTSARWLQFAGDVDVVRGFVSGDATEKTYLTDGTLPLVINSALVDTGGDDEYPESSYPLGIPAPSAALTAAASGSGGSGDDRGIQYVFTYVRTWADGTTDEGPPSPVSTEIQAMDGETINISGLGTAVSGRADLTHKRIYRINSGETGADFQFVKEVTMATATTTDAVADADLEEVLPSEGWDAPPATLRGLVPHPGMFLVGFVGNTIRASEVNQPHAWPASYAWTVPFDIVGLGVFGTSIVVLTKSYPYLLTGNSPDAMYQERMAAPAPCLSKRGIVNTEAGVMFPCPRGLYAVGADGAGLATPNYLTKEKWAPYYPDTIHAAWHNGQYIGFYTSGSSGMTKEGGGFVFDPSEANATLGKLGFYAHALHVDAETDTLYYLDYDALTDINYVKEWEANSTKRTLSYTSKEATLSGKANFAFARIDADFPSSLTVAEQAAYEAERLAAMAANEALFLAGPCGEFAAIGGGAIGMFATSGDNRGSVAASYTQAEGVTLRLYGEGDTLRHQVAVSSTNPFPLLGGFKDRSGYIQLSGKVETFKVDIATSVEELY
jgi:hypothetical protein